MCTSGVSSLDDEESEEKDFEQANFGKKYLSQVVDRVIEDEKEELPIDNIINVDLQEST